MSGLVDEILEIDPGNLNAKFLLTMFEQNWRQIQRLIIDAQQAVNHLNWQTVLRLAQNILALDPVDLNGLALRAAAYRGLGDQDQPTNWLSTAQRFLPIIPAVGVFAGLLVFLGRLYLESYYSYFGIPPSALNLDVQDYAFGSFPVVLFVLVASSGVLIYWRAMPAGWLVIYLSILFWTPFNFWLTYASVAYPRFTRNPFEHTFQDGTRLTLSRPVDYLFRVILALLPAYLLAVIITTTILLVAITFVIIFVTLVAGSLFGFDFSLGLLEHVAHSLANSLQSNSSAIEIPILLSEFNPSNIPGFRALASGIATGLGAVTVISVLEAILPFRLKEWAAPSVLVGLILVVMPVVTHFMAKDQAIADLGDNTGWFLSNLPVASFESQMQLNEEAIWDDNCLQAGIDRVYYSPWLKIVVVNERVAYVIPKKPTPEEPNRCSLGPLKPEPGNLPDDLYNRLYTISMEDVDAIAYRSPAMERRVR